MAKKILLMEDEELIISLLQKKLVKEGYDVAVARNGQEGLELMRKEKPALVLLDIIMPKKGGFEVMEEMSNDESLKNTPIIIISNSGQPVELGRAKKLGVKDWVIKVEFDPEEVVDKVKKQIGK
jgi:two-component system alkaline phosphatase synthesis response regulator PhoP